MWVRRGCAFATAVSLSACSLGSPATTPHAVQRVPSEGRSIGSPIAESTPTLPPGVMPPPRWLGKRPLPTRADGLGVVQPTPRVLRNRQFTTTDVLPPPDDTRFHWTAAAIPTDVLRRSTWHPACPVPASQLRYLTLTFWGFDDRPHTGEMIVNASVARTIVTVFRKLFEERFPIEEMRVTSDRDLNAPPTGDGNNTASFVCRPVVRETTWSQHAYGLAVDVDPFQNPYVSGDAIVPERASAYADRNWKRRGMILPGDVVTQAFGAAGWGWGGQWNTLKDWMHFSSTGQ